jgi:1-acyl-sn-glycerol-3-phosphate acyltransferase
VVLGVTGGLRVSGAAALPAGACVIVANHSRVLCAAFPVRRAGGGGADLAAAARLLAAGHDVIVYPEGTRSRDGRIGDFHRGAARLAALAGVPLIPAGITGTRTLLPPGGSACRAPVAVRFGAPLLPRTFAPIGGDFMIAGSYGVKSTGTARDHEGGPRGGVEEATAEARVRVAELVASGV